MWPIKLSIGCMLLNVRSLMGQVANPIQDVDCRTDDFLLYQNGAVDRNFDAMMRYYNETCTSDQCGLQPSDPLFGTLTWDFGGASFAMRTSCQSRPGYRACEAKTTVYHNLSVEGLDVRGYVVEENKGICFPPTCSDDQANLLDPTPGQCDPSTMDCEIVSYEVNCPNRRVSSDTSTCEQDQLPSTSPFFVVRGITEVAIYGDCASMLTGSGSIGLCQASSGAVNANLYTDFTDYTEKIQFRSHEAICKQNGGEICYFDMEADMTIPGEMIREAAEEYIPLASAGDVVIRNSFTNFPRCMATTCKSADVENVLAWHANDNLLNNFNLPCDLNSDNCNIKITNMNCGSPETVSPTQAIESLFPTPGFDTYAPTPDETFVPSFSTSEPTPSPTSFPTSLPIATPSTLPTSELTSSPSSEPTSNPTSLSTGLPSSDPAQEPAWESSADRLLMTSPTLLTGLMLLINFSFCFFSL